MNLFLDTNDLIYLAKGGTKLSSGPSSSFSTLGLDQLSASGYTPVLTDTVYLEATNGVFPDVSTIEQWVTQNNIQPQPTGIPPGNDGGERSIVKLLSDPNLPQFSQQPYTVLSSDKGFNWSAKNVSNVVGAVDFLNTLLSNGTTTVDNYIAVRDNIKSNAPSTPGIQQLLDNSDAITSSPLAYNPITNQNENINSSDVKDITATEAESGLPPGESESTFGLSKVIAAIEQLSATNPNIAAALDTTVKGLGDVGLVFIAYDVLNSGQQALQQIQAGNNSGAALTIENLSARISLGIGGAEIGAEFGFFLGGLGGPFAEITAPLGGILGAVVGSIAGAQNAQAAVNAINQAVQSAVNTLSQAVSGDDPSFSAVLGGGNIGSVLTANRSGTYQLTSSTIINENANQFAGTINGTNLATDGSGDASIAFPDGQTMIAVSATSNLSPGSVTPGQSEFTGSTVTFVDGRGTTHTATILYQASNGNYVIDGSTETNDGGITIDVPTELDSSVTIQSINTPSTPNNNSLIIETPGFDTDGSQTENIDDIKNGSVAYTEDTSTASDGTVDQNIAGTGDVSSLSDATITLSNGGSSATVGGTGDTLNEGSGDVFNVQNTGGPTDTINLSGGDYVGLLAGNGYAVNGNNALVGTWDDTDFTVTGNNNTIMADVGAPAGDSTAGSSGTVTGTGDTLTEGSGDVFNVQNTSGPADTINLGGGDYVGLLGGSGYAVSGNNVLVGTWDDTNFTVTGNNDHIIADVGAPAGDSTAGSSGTVMGTGDTLTEGSGDVFNVQNTGGPADTVNLGSGDYVGLLGGSGYAVSGNNVLVGTWDDTNFTVTGNNDHIIADVGAPAGDSTAGSSGTVMGTGDTLTEGSGDVFNVQNTGGPADTINLGSGDYVGLLGGSGYAVSGNNVLVGTWDDTNFTVTGNNDHIIADVGAPAGDSTAGSSGTVMGTGDTLTEGTGDSFNVQNTGGGSDTIVITGTDDTVTGSNENIVIVNNGSVTVTGANDTISGGTGDVATVLGDNDTLTLGTGGSAVLTGTDDVVDASGGTVTLGNDSSATVNGSSETISGGTNDNAIVSGDTNTLTLGTGGSAVLTGTDDVVDASNGTVSLSDDSSATVNGANNTVSGASGDALSVIGNGNDITTSGSVEVNGSQNVVNASGSDINVANGTSVTIAGSNNTIDGGSSDSVTVTGGYDTLAFGGNSSASVTGLADTVYASNDGINVGEYSTVGIDGNGNGIQAGSFSTLGLIGTGDGITDSASTIHFYSAGSTDSLNGSNDDVTDTSDNLAITGDADKNYGDDGNLVITGYDNDEYGDHDQVIIYGSQNYTYGNDDTITPYFGDDDPSYGQGDSDPDGTNYQNDGTTDLGDTGTFDDGDYGFAAGAGNRLNVVGQYDLAHGYTAAAQIAGNAFGQANMAVAAASAGISTASVSPFEGAAWSGRVVTWSFAATGGSPTSPFSGAVQSQYQAAIEQALQTWSDVTGLTFKQVPDSPATDISIGWGTFDTAQSGVVGYTSYQGTSGQLQPGVIVRLEDPAQDSIVGQPDTSQIYSGTDVQLYQAALHEIGHALGLGESSDPNSIMFPELGAQNTGLDATDLANAIALYGTPPTSTTGVQSPVGQELIAPTAQSSGVSPPSDNTIQISTSNTILDPGAGSHTLQFIAGATSDSVVLHAVGVDAIYGFDPTSGNMFDLRSLFSEAHVSLAGNTTGVGSYVTINPIAGGAGLYFDPEGHGSGGLVATVYGSDDMVSKLTTSRPFIT